MEAVSVPPRELSEQERQLRRPNRFWLNVTLTMIVNVATYIEYSGRINRLLAPIVIDILKRGIPVVMDFPGNTRNQRAWFRSIIDQAGVEHELHFVDTPDDVCKAQLKARSAHLPPGTKWTTEEDFDLIASHFRAPEHDEAFTIVRHTRG